MGWNYSGFSLFPCFLFFYVMIPALQAHIAEYDDYWKHRALLAKENTDAAYHPNPEEVTDHFNQHVARSLMGFGNNTRRELKGKKGKNRNSPCEATNPIDQCWRCDPNWSKNRKRLADCALGFGRGTTGGKAGRFYIVTDPSDNDMVNPKPGTLRYAVTLNRPLWIVFKKSMVIKLNQELIMTSDKTIDGRGANVHIAYGAGITLQFVKNVIIHGLHIHDIIQGSGGLIRDGENHFGLRTKSDGDGISLFCATNIWLDHLSMYHCYDGLIDAIKGSTAVTISNCHFTNHNEVMLFGASDSHTEDQKMQITVAFTHFGKGLVQRMPRCRFGFIHVVNNDYTHWLMYAIGGSSHPTIISQGNRFVAPANAAAKEVTKRDYSPESVWKGWVWRSEGDIMVDGAYFVQSGDPNAIQKYSARYNLMGVKPAHMVSKLTKHSGTLNCHRGRPC